MSVTSAEKESSTNQPSFKDISLPQLGSAQAWWKYLTNVADLSPVPRNLKFGQIPSGVLQLGGTFVVDHDIVLYAHADQFPGDHPDIFDVLRALSLTSQDIENFYTTSSSS
mmetsp:Transcript_18386/g.23922  ORF Transcript_18386/g.23922 Transcript_18386/m.23922 type:complete len:111 (+) Transcript_18386:623-955(+)|eukprot:CAMPEP_0197290958 /NCGR_PEP_ID=MMETSP0890-20130614/10350_1 /TAXON_ID=44058 ORGANISM="Aureoumbra lagunensis, Strain CCMP1510" /NCGR_SAMPLE_ID=MMETSP0890 /ASSEMBLY_ACC=CAM_ASM_000533 /LENGTH=110 /DNA_ID=CAMNT_0042763369 /DNA_START=612 /DNA_END=947 /DNA_ORIENTATION=-